MEHHFDTSLMIHHQDARNGVPTEAVGNHFPRLFVGNAWVLAHVDDDLFEPALRLLRFADVLADGVLACLITS